MINGARPQKAAMLIAQRIVRDALRDHLQPGDLLPAERLMLERYEIGRGTLREALRLLEFEGVITLKPGPRGGPVMQDPDPSHLASTFVLLMQLKRAPFRAIVEVRSAIEPMISSLAAARMTDHEIADLEESISKMRDNLKDQEIFFESNRRFHDIIAWSSGNPLLSYIVDSLLSIMDGTVIGIDYPDARRRAILQAHTEIYKAIASRDPAAASHRMQQHLEAYVRYAERRHPDALDRVIPWDRALSL
jgi:GntR family transcriptional regulator, transcriptional repressor for pyruvate dehydrogenase complex